MFTSLPSFSSLGRRLSVGLLVGLAPCTFAALSPAEQALADWCNARQEEMTAMLEHTVKIDSPTENHVGVKQVGEFFGGELAALGFTSRMIAQPPEVNRADHLFSERTGKKGKRLLLIGHLDTVLPGGKFTRDGDIGRGSGVEDIKGGDVVIVYALKALHAARALDDTQIIVVMTGDEEMPGIPVELSRKDFIAAAKRSDIALAFEGGIPGQGTIARRGSSTWNLEVTGPTGHSSRVFSAAMGGGAIYEAARILDLFQTELRKEPNLTANAAIIAGGSDLKILNENPLSVTVDGKTNIIPPRVFARGDMRAATPESLERAKKVMRDIVAKNGLRTAAKIDFVDRYPPMAPLPKNFEVLAVFDDVSRDFGQGPIVATDALVRGAGDSAFASPHAAVLDGLGPMGRGAHAANETVELKSLPTQAARTAVLIYRLTR
ncbi:MAG: M20/M25/M40 family metallo-hydrolase [Opitutus sp.]|nr:M20/M25/M40 family metallo-hydrolase [Opitutus sp.]